MAIVTVGGPSLEGAEFTIDWDDATNRPVAIHVQNNSGRTVAVYVTEVATGRTFPSNGATTPATFGAGLTTVNLPTGGGTRLQGFWDPVHHRFDGVEWHAWFI